MFNFFEAKRAVTNWPKDIKGRYEKELPIIKKIIELIIPILEIWQKDIMYRDYNQKILLCEAKYPKLINFKSFYQEYINIIFNSDSINNLKKRGYSEYNAKLGIINFLLKKCKCVFNEEELISFSKFLQDYEMLINMRDKYKFQLILENYSLIYRNCLMISSYQQNYSEFYQSIGRYKDVNSVFGPNGEKLKSGSEEAINFINSLENLLAVLEEEQANIELNYTPHNR